MALFSLVSTTVWRVQTATTLSGWLSTSRLSWDGEVYKWKMRILHIWLPAFRQMAWILVLIFLLLCCKRLNVCGLTGYKYVFLAILVRAIISKVILVQRTEVRPYWAKVQVGTSLDWGGKCHKPFGWRWLSLLPYSVKEVPSISLQLLRCHQCTEFPYFVLNLRDISHQPEPSLNNIGGCPYLGFLCYFVFICPDMDRNDF